MLGTTPFTSRYWVTYREAQRLGGHVRRGERASPVVFRKWRIPEDLARLREKSGREDPAPCVPFTAAVFNLDQVERVKRPADDVPNRPSDPVAVADGVVQSMPDKPGWAEALRKDQRLNVRAASAAQRGSDYIRGKATAPKESEPERS